MATPAQQTPARGLSAANAPVQDTRANTSQPTTHPRHQSKTPSRVPQNTPCTPAVPTQKRKSNFGKSLSAAFITPSLPRAKGPSSSAHVPHNTPVTVAKVTNLSATLPLTAPTPTNTAIQNLKIAHNAASGAATPTEGQSQSGSNVQQPNSAGADTTHRPLTAARVGSNPGTCKNSRVSKSTTKTASSARKSASLSGAFSFMSHLPARSRSDASMDATQSTPSQATLDAATLVRSRLSPMEELSPARSPADVQIASKGMEKNVDVYGHKHAGKHGCKHASESNASSINQYVASSTRDSQSPPETSQSQPSTDVMSDSSTDTEQYTYERTETGRHAPLHTRTHSHESIKGVKRTLHSASGHSTSELRPVKKQAVQANRADATAASGNCAIGTTDTAGQLESPNVGMYVRPPSTDSSAAQTLTSSTTHTNTHAVRTRTPRSRSPAPGAADASERSHKPEAKNRSKPVLLTKRVKAKNFVTESLRSPEMLRTGQLSPTKSMLSPTATGSGQLSGSKHGSPIRVRSPSSPVQQLGDAFSATSIKSRTNSRASLRQESVVLKQAQDTTGSRTEGQVSAVRNTPAAQHGTSKNRTCINSTSTCKSYASTGMGNAGVTERKRKRTETGAPNKCASHAMPVMKKAPSVAALFGGKAKEDSLSPVPTSTAPKKPTRRTLGGVALSLLGSGTKTTGSDGKKAKSPTGSFTGRSQSSTTATTQKQPNASSTQKSQSTYFEASSSEAAEAGAGLGLYDEVRYIIDGLGPTNSLSVRCSSATSLATQCCTNEFRLHMRANDVVPQAIKAISDLARAPHQVLTVSVAHALLILSDDALTSDFRGVGLALLLKWIRDLGPHGWKGRVTDTLHIPAKSSRNDSAKYLQRISTALKNSAHTHCIDPMGKPSLAMLLLHTLSSLTKLLNGFGDQLIQKQRLTDISLMFASTVEIITGALGVRDPDFVMAINTAEVCLQIFENTTFMNADSLTEENVPFLLKLTENLVRVLRYIDRSILTGADETALPVEDALKLLTGCVRVLMNLTHIERVRHYLGAGLSTSAETVSCTCSTTCTSVETCTSASVSLRAIASTDTSTESNKNVDTSAGGVVESCGYGMDILVTCALTLPPVLARKCENTRLGTEGSNSAIITSSSDATSRSEATNANKGIIDVDRSEEGSSGDHIHTHRWPETLSRKSTELYSNAPSGIDTQPTPETPLLSPMTDSQLSAGITDMTDVQSDARPSTQPASLETFNSTATVDLNYRDDDCGGMIDGVAKATNTPSDLRNTSANSESMDTSSEISADKSNASASTSTHPHMHSITQTSQYTSTNPSVATVSSAVGDTQTDRIQSSAGKAKSETSAEMEEEAQKAKQRLESVEYDLFVHTFGLLVNVLECESEARQSVCSMEITLPDGKKLSFLARVADLFEMWSSEAESSLSEMRSAVTLPVGGRARDIAMRQQQRQTELRTLMAYAAYLIGWLVRDNKPNKQRAVAAFECPTRPTISINILVDRLRDFIKLQELMGMPQTEESRKSTDIALTTLVALAEGCH
ncbi:hypothetical protein SARC_04741 [Sphaeroforma arctica JP610]|uniref:WAPL domain-containing protein n=1 Tax=Sphaeroforma arctica JP610 TaxID=667725 RepID=A0A0L0G2D3_9EUKA|nr:hypothetical protein SARC_04741 [Sphaeroforma arctica JP610]KNC82994.1 hypothetical protein SARC_04741 [Sphaeroforma arctica JP610]|eukprot:XP_014156896.1 hypothetical protein SARC_04741 [Sphaeroforma arctica JP610]